MHISRGADVEQLQLHAKLYPFSSKSPRCQVEPCLCPSRCHPKPDTAVPDPAHRKVQRYNIRRHAVFTRTGLLHVFSLPTTKGIMKKKWNSISPFLHDVFNDSTEATLDRIPNEGEGKGTLSWNCYFHYWLFGMIHFAVANPVASQKIFEKQDQRCGRLHVCSSCSQPLKNSSLA